MPARGDLSRNFARRRAARLGREREFKRAEDEQERFILAIVAGLEEGQTPQVRLIPDPLRQLKWEPNVAIIVSGLITTKWSGEIPELVLAVPGDDVSAPGAADASAV